MVYVLNKDGQPLMPTERHGKVKRLLKSGKAKVIRKCPFTIKLLYDTDFYTQELVLGVDTGSGTLGAAVSDSFGEIVYLSEVMLRNDIAEKMTQRRMYRRNRRSRKTRYRKPRFNNRENSTRKNRLSPTVKSKLDSHIKEVEHIKKLLPISRIVFEMGQFDPHLMKNPCLANPNYRHWGYQKGPNYGFENTKAAILNRDGYMCKICRNRQKNTRLEVHHIVFRSNGGSDEPENLITLCHKCHKKLHNGGISPDFRGKTKGTLKYATQMNTIRTRLLEVYPDAVETYGYVTKANRLNLGIGKEHYYDACTIATQGNPFTVKCMLFRKKCVPDGDFQKTKGIRSEQPVTTGKIYGFRKFDRVCYFGKEYFIKGRMSTGYVILMDINGKKADFSDMPKGFKTPKMSNLKRLGARTSWIVTKEAVIQNTA